jgi:hypothetical protein
MEDENGTQWEERLPSNRIGVESVALAADEDREQQRFAKTVLGESNSGSPRVSTSEDSDDGIPMPDADGNGAAQAMTGNGFHVVVDDPDQRGPGDLGVAPGYAQASKVVYLQPESVQLFQSG